MTGLRGEVFAPSSAVAPPGAVALTVPVARLLAVNGLIRIASAASGQLFAFVLAERMASQIGEGSALVGLLGACFYVTELVGAPVAGRIADRRGQLRVLRWGPVFGAVSALVGAAAALGHVGLAITTGILIVARTAEGASAACAVPTTLVLLSRATENDAPRRMRVMGLFEIASLAGMIAGYVLAGIGWDALSALSFLLLPPLYLSAWLVSGRMRSGAELLLARPATIVRTLRALARERGNVSFGIAWLAVNAVVGVWLQQAPFLFKLPDPSPTQRLVGGFSGQAIGFIFGAWGLTFLAGIALWSLFAAAWPRWRALAVALVGLLGLTATLWLLNRGAPLVLLAVAVGFVLVESGFTPAAFAHLADLTERHDTSRGAALGLYALLLGMGQLAGNVIGTPFAARWQMNGVLAVTALLTFVALAGVLHMRTTGREVRVR